jgi:NDP-sugar pyrophosphorylase family protein
VLPDRPKGLAPVGDQSFLEIQISLLRAQGARRFVLCVGHLAAQIHDCLGDGSRLGVHIEYSVESGTLLGTAGALGLAERFFETHALVLNGDTYLAADYTRILEHHVEERAARRVAATVTLACLDETERYGTVLLDETGRYLTGFKEKLHQSAGPGWLNAGTYVIERDLIERIPRAAFCSLEKDVFPSALADGLPIAAHITDQPFFDIGTAEDLQRFCRLYEDGSLAHSERPFGRRAG